ncbi:hypothetical protein C7431_10672 [Pantoea allii]|uniref:Uncharacterized protein n=1 Tax=Pantoea allii TaxID=574096 RepID=A0A2V2B7X2_9GAMM|nr:hypothetical protein [Pantoea allii]MBW1253690.1 hypothetical protein [Pantoea allii]MBW1262813.1 hypothetical protein [Pantoea allii]MBW1285370.1 hypothetical protein [Pantoea allii]MDJ0088862.1 hypothetical protein [Pantoea allii]ORM82877.1 hypothetical protein HA38_19635 [Pantoea allii]
MADETVNNGSSGLFDDLKKEMNNFLDKGFEILESEQSKVNKALFDALSPEQRDAFCQSLSEQNVKSKRIEKITGKSQSTVNRHLNGKR